MSMPQPRDDMFPDQSKTDQGVSEDVKPQMPTEPTAGVASHEATQGKGSSTPDNQLYAALKAERERRQALEARLEALEVANQPSQFVNTDDVYSDEGKLILKQMQERDAKIAALEEREKMRETFAAFPDLRGKEADFTDFRKDYPNVNIERVAKLFLSESGITPQKAQPKGLESTSGGAKTTETSTGFTAEEIDRIRTTQPRLFIKLVREGKIDGDNIK